MHVHGGGGVPFISQAFCKTHAVEISRISGRQRYAIVWVFTVHYTLIFIIKIIKIFTLNTQVEQEEVQEQLTQSQALDLSVFSLTVIAPYKNDYNDRH